MRTYLLTPWSRVLLEKLTGSAASQEIPRIFGTRSFVYNTMAYLLLTTRSVTGKNAEGSGRGLLYHVTSLLDKS